jgi:hypothetical protein
MALQRCLSVSLGLRCLLARFALCSLPLLGTGPSLCRVPKVSRRTRRQTQLRGELCAAVPGKHGTGGRASERTDLDTALLLPGTEPDTSAVHSVAQSAEAVSLAGGSHWTESMAWLWISWAMKARGRFTSWEADGINLPCSVIGCLRPRGTRAQSICSGNRPSGQASLAVALRTRIPAETPAYPTELFRGSPQPLPGSQSFLCSTQCGRAS